jgi:ribosomal protein L23
MNIYPRKTEKAYGQSLKDIYVFEVPTDANKQQIIESVQSQYKVTVTNVKTLIQSGKAVRVSRGKRAHPGITNRKDLKKAYVTLAKGDSIKVFDEVKEAEPATKAVKKEKK